MMTPNAETLVPVLIIVLLMRTKQFLCWPLFFLRKLRFFVTNATRTTLKSPITTKTVSTIDASGVDNTSIIEKQLKKLELSMVELDGSLLRGAIISKLFLYDWYDSIVHLGIAALLSHIWTMLSHCVMPLAPYHVWGSVLATMLIVLSIYSLLKVLYMTGRNAMEVKVAGIVGLMTFTLSLALLLAPVDFDLTGLSLENVFQSTAIHFNVLGLHISSSIPLLNVNLVTGLFKVSLSMGAALMASGMVIPALRYSQTFVVLMFGSAHEKGTPSIRWLLSLDYFLPLILACSIFLSPAVFKQFTTALSTNHTDTTNITTPNGILLFFQLILVLVMMIVRLICLRPHMQSFLDAVVRSISMEIAVGNEADKVGIQNKVSMRYQYIAPAALQYVALPLTILGIALLVHKNSPMGTGFCVGLKSIIGLNTIDNLAISQQLLSTNATQIALDLARSPSSPKFDEAMYMFLMHAGEDSSCFTHVLFFPLAPTHIVHSLIIAPPPPHTHPPTPSMIYIYLALHLTCTLLLRKPPCLFLTHRPRSCQSYQATVPHPPSLTYLPYILHVPSYMTHRPRSCQSYQTIV